MILLKEIKIKDFLSHENTTISFKPNQKLLVDGRSGSGKSSVTEAILWALYGKGRSDNRALVRRGSKGAVVSIKLGDELTETVITRSVSAAGKNTLTATQNTGSTGSFLPIMYTGIKEIQNWIETDLLKASYELFTNSVAYPQENENSFVKANASRRKDLLLEIVRAGNFDELYEKTKDALKDNEVESTIASTKMEGLVTTIKAAEEQASLHDTYKAKVDDTSSKIDVLSISEKDLEAQVSNISGITRQIEDKKSLVRSLTNSITTIDAQLKSDAATVARHSSLDIEGARKDVAKAEELAKEALGIEKELEESNLAQQKINAHLANKPHVSDYTKDIELINQRLIPLIKDTGKCPAGDSCPFVVPIKGQIDFLTEQITEKTDKGAREKAALEAWERAYVSLVPVKDTVELYGRLRVLRDEITRLSKAKEIIVQYESFEKTLVEIKEREMRLSGERSRTEAELISVNNNVVQLEETLVKFDVNKINLELSNIRMAKNDLQKEKEEATFGVNVAIRAKETIKESEKQLMDLKKTIGIALENKEALELLKEALSPRGIKAVVIDYLVPQLEDRINNVLGQMSDFRIRLDTQKATADEEGIKEGLFITVINDLKEELPFQSYSGGEKVKITIAISEALASLMSQIGFRIMDENIVSLDRESTEGFVEVLTKLQEKFPQLLIISHLQEVKDIFENQILITKTNGISKIT